MKNGFSPASTGFGRQLEHCPSLNLRAVSKRSASFRSAVEIPLRVENKARSWVLAILAATEIVKHLFRPCGSRRRQFVNHTYPVRASKLCSAIKISGVIENHSAHRVRSACTPVKRNQGLLCPGSA